MAHESLALAALVGLAGCAAPPAGPLDPAAPDAGLAARDVLPGDIEAARAWSGLRPLPRSDGQRSAADDPDDPGFWRGAALDFHPRVRAARARLLAARAAAGGDATSPALAAATERAAVARLEAAQWAATADVDRGLVALGTAIARERALEGLLAEAEADVPRLDVLSHGGWVAPAEVSDATATMLMLQHELSRARVASAAAREALGRSAGLPPDHPALSGVTPAAVDRFPPAATAEPPADELPARLPELRALTLEHAAAEAVVQRERARPDADDLRVQEVLIRRDAAGLAAQDALLAARARLATLRVRLGEARTSLAGHLPDIDESTRLRWRAAREAFATDPSSLADWTEALAARLPALTALQAGRAEIRLAAIDLAEACGPADPVARESAVAPVRRESP